jgi:hypothetical protein
MDVGKYFSITRATEERSKIQSIGGTASRAITSRERWYQRCSQQTFRLHAILALLFEQRNVEPITEPNRGRHLLSAQGMIPVTVL